MQAVESRRGEGEQHEKGDGAANGVGARTALLLRRVEEVGGWVSAEEAIGAGDAAADETDTEEDEPP